MDRPELYYVSEWFFNKQQLSFKWLNVERNVRFLNFVTATRKICRSALSLLIEVHVKEGILVEERASPLSPHSCRLWFCHLVPRTLWRATEILNVNVTNALT